MISSSRPSCRRPAAARLCGGCCATSPKAAPWGIRPPSPMPASSPRCGTSTRARRRNPSSAISGSVPLRISHPRPILKIHEYQAKEILRKHGVPTLAGQIATTPDDARSAAEQVGTPVAVVKAQIHAGGRGKGGGVKVARTPDEARDAAAKMLGDPLVTHQTGPAGQVVRKVYVEAGCDIAKEYYLGMLLDRANGRIVAMASTEGGVEIESVAEEHPEKILKVWIDPAVGLQPYQARQLAFGLQLDPN